MIYCCLFVLNDLLSFVDLPKAQRAQLEKRSVAIIAEGLGRSPKKERMRLYKR
jgi:hypothetical protein